MGKKRQSTKNLKISDFPEVVAALKNKEHANKSAGSNIKIEWQCFKCNSTWMVAPNEKIGYNKGCPYCSNKSVNKTNCLTTTHPELAKELVNEADGHKLTAGSHKKVEWKCKKCNSTYLAMVYSRSGPNQTDCPYCSYPIRLVNHSNCLNKTNPEFTSQLLNKQDGERLSAGSKIKIEWMCSTCSTVFKTSPDARTNKKTGCPSCVKFGYKRNKNAYLYVLDAPTHLVIGISNTDGVVDRTKFYKNRIILLKFYGNGETVLAAETLIKKTCTRYTNSTEKGEITESFIKNCLSQIIQICEMNGLSLTE
jgi:DNA-directed RNA polymerase subunit RPC12/RpoP